MDRPSAQSAYFATDVANKTKPTKGLFSSPDYFLFAYIPKRVKVLLNHIVFQSVGVSKPHFYGDIFLFKPQRFTPVIKKVIGLPKTCSLYFHYFAINAFCLLLSTYQAMAEKPASVMMMVG